MSTWDPSTPPGHYDPTGAAAPGPAFPPPGSPVDVGNGVGTGGYWLGSVLLVVGIVLAVGAAVVGVTRVVDAFAFPDVVDSSGEVWIDEPGGKVVFVVGPERATTPFVPMPIVTVTDPDGRTVPTAQYTANRSTTRYEPGTGLRQEAVAVATFEATHPGYYELSATDMPSGSTLGVGEGVDGRFGVPALVIVGGSLLGLAGLVVLIVTAVRRSRRRSAPPGYPGVPMGTYPPGVAPYPGYPYPAPGSFTPPAVPSHGPPGYPVPPVPGGPPPVPGAYPAGPPSGGPETWPGQPPGATGGGTPPQWG